MASMSSGPIAVKGAEEVLATYRHDKRAGRIDFRIRSISGDNIMVQVVEEDLEGNETNLGSETEIVSRGDQTITVVSQKPVVRVKSGENNTGSAYIRLDAQYIGLPFTGGQLDLDANLARESFDGPNISGSGK